MRRFRLLFLLLLLPLSLLAETAKKHPSPISCPSIDQLYRDPTTLLWKSKRGGWKSFAPSFATRATTFLGAQWQGVKVGNLFCVYQGDPTTFSINLHYYTLTKEPTSESWGKNNKGLRNCYSNNTHDCLFTPVPAPNNTSLDQQLDSIKSAPKQPQF